MQNKYIQLFLLYVLLVVKLGAGVKVTGAKTASGATGQDIAGKFNESNEITIAITLSGNQADNGSNDVSENCIAVYVGFSTTESITISNSLEDDGLSWTKTFSDNTVTYDALKKDMDFNCGNIINGSSTISELGKQLFELILDTASGRKTCSEQQNYGDNEFNPWHLGPTV